MSMDIYIFFLSFFTPSLPMALKEITAISGSDTPWRCSNWYQNMKIGKNCHWQVHIKFHSSPHRVPLGIDFGVKIHDGSFWGSNPLEKKQTFPNSNILYNKTKDNLAMVNFYKNNWVHFGGFDWSILMFSKATHIRYQMTVSFLLIILQKELGPKNEQRVI